MSFATLYFLNQGESLYDAHKNRIKSVDLSKNQQYIQLQQSSKYFDCELSQQGYKQCQKAKQELKELQFDLIFVSPYYRALLTCEQVFKNHKSKPKIIVEPLLGQKLNTPCDVGTQLAEWKKNFEYDFSSLDGTDLDKWYLENLQQSTKQKIQNALKKDNVKDPNEIARITLEFITNEQEQSWEHLAMRVEKLKNKIAQYYYQKKKILLLGHSQIIRAITATGFRETGQPINDIFVPNGQPAKICILFPKKNVDPRNQSSLNRVA